MPTYDFVCQNCGQRFDIFLSFREYGTRKVKCVHCGSTQVRRRITRIRVARSEESRMESLADDTALDGLDDDPQALGRMMRKMGREMGEDLPPEFDDVADRLESGQSPDEIDSALPEIGDDSAGGLDDDL